VTNLGREKEYSRRPKAMPHSSASRSREQKTMVQTLLTFRVDSEECPRETLADLIARPRA